MKHLTKILAFLILLPLGFSSCTKDDDNKPATQTPAELVKGTWKSSSLKSEYYNSSGAKLYEETQNSNGLAIFKEKQLDLANANGAVFDTQDYTLETVSGKTTLYLSKNGGAKTGFDLTRLNKTNMTWSIEQTKNVNYEENGVTKTSQKNKQTYEFVKQ
ncbi:hypothetical protein [Adhaeribacter aquaticus]|uniref:hypothetical protein n=1 Tax=Adhaeribacter aquaticus TaxID=299567 RepID=UPI0004143B85|nr:hypothetical protein [Adhaeribacter aquaticus]